MTSRGGSIIFKPAASLELRPARNSGQLGTPASSELRPAPNSSQLTSSATGSASSELQPAQESSQLGSSASGKCEPAGCSNQPKSRDSVAAQNLWLAKSLNWSSGTTQPELATKMLKSSCKIVVASLCRCKYSLRTSKLYEYTRLVAASRKSCLQNLQDELLCNHHHTS